MSQSGFDRRYTRTLIGDFARSALGIAPPHWREAIAERWFRRKGVPGPANEHIFQYLISKTFNKRADRELRQQMDALNLKGTGREQQRVAALKGADLFYARQYRQILNPTMGAFAATATLALLACGGKSRGSLWRRHRPLHVAMVEEAGGAPPIAVLDHQSVAVPLLLPAPSKRETEAKIGRWLAGRSGMPRSYKARAAGEKVKCATSGARARRRSAAGALIELACAIRHTGKLAILALHPHDPDAMGLHITLFGTQILSPEALEAGYGLEKNFLNPWRKAAAAQNSVLHFFVGATEELFAHCSMNLFVKRRVPQPEGTPPGAWSPSEPLGALLANQCELFQATVSASGLPGVSPRNGNIGKVGYVIGQGRKRSVIVPYFNGNFIHGHAAKLWSNPHGALMIRDDHTALSFVALQGPAHAVSHAWVKTHFPALAAETAKRHKQSGEPAPDPEYWLVHQVSEILQQHEQLAANELDPARPPNTIHAAGRARYGKKPEYFAPGTLPRYDQEWQHEREAHGRPADPSGDEHRKWERQAAPALADRRAKLERDGAQADPEEQLFPDLVTAMFPVEWIAR